jgi:hypothetical protein
MLMTTVGRLNGKNGVEKPALAMYDDCQQRNAGGVPVTSTGMPEDSDLPTGKRRGRG